MGGLGRAALAAALLTALLSALVAMPYDKELSYGFQRNTTATPASAPITEADGLPYTRRTIKFYSEGTACDAWLYTPLPPPPPPPPPPSSVDTAEAAPNPDPDTTGNATDTPPQSSAPPSTSSTTSSSAPPRRLPVVLMAHGLGGQKDMGLHRFADVFARAGLGVLVFDYRSFGGSEGQPRHWVSPRRHVQDWRAAVEFVKAGGLGPEYDTEKVALWGTSLAGGHVLVAAAELPPGTVRAVISMVPHLDGVEVSKASLRRRGLAGSLRLLAAGAHDALRAAATRLAQRAGLLADPTLLLEEGEQQQKEELAAAGAAANDSSSSSSSGTLPGSLQGVLAALRGAVGGAVLRWLGQPAYVKLVGAPGELALMQLSPGDMRAYFAKHPKTYQGGWRPVALARFTLEASAYRPITSVPRLPPGLPVLFISASRDELCPAHLVRRAVGLLPGGRGRLLELGCSHFEAYLGPQLAAAAQAMVDFAREELPSPSRAHKRK